MKTLDTKKARVDADKWLVANGERTPRDQAVAEELLAYDLLDACNELDVLRADRPTKRDLEHELTSLLNRHSAETTSNTPDFVLARFMLDSLAAFNNAEMRRAEWHSQPHAPTLTLADLRLSVRTERVINNLGVTTLDELCAVKGSTLRKAKNCGPRTYQEIVLELSRVGRSLAPEGKRVR